MSLLVGKKPRAKSAYIFFTMEKRQEIVEQNPGMSVKDILKEIARLWKELPDEEREKYQKMADDDTARVAGLSERASPKPFVSNQSKPALRFGIGQSHLPENQENSDESNESDDDQKPIQRPNRPRAKSAYIFFTIEKRREIVEQNPDMTLKDILKEMARSWKELPDEEREKFNKMAKEEKERIKTKM